MSQRPRILVVQSDVTTPKNIFPIVYRVEQWKTDRYKWLSRLIAEARFPPAPTVRPRPVLWSDRFELDNFLTTTLKKQPDWFYNHPLQLLDYFINRVIHITQLYIISQVSIKSKKWVVKVVFLTLLETQRRGTLWHLCASLPKWSSWANIQDRDSIECWNFEPRS